jgi:hypothetical protein
MAAVADICFLSADPDLSNPTRNRWERPLDTIRSFEAAIEGDYARRSMYRSGKFLLPRSFYI